MEQPSFDYQKDSKKGGLLESASRRVRMIFSVMASPNRIDILRILNAKGPLTYSELKALAGFKSKKESGKFAYHLRKLLRQLPGCPQQDRASVHHHEPWQTGAEPCPPDRGALNHRERQDVREDKQAHH